MREYLGTVIENNDEDKEKKIQAHIIGLTDDGSVADEDLPWAYPLEEFCIVPQVDEKVIICVYKEEGKEDYDYSRLYYKRFTEITYPECDGISDSDSYSIKNDNIVGSETSPIDSVEYPKNRVIKLSNITIEFDEGNKRFEITDENGNYYRSNEDEVTIKSNKKINIISKEKISIYNGDSDLKDILDDVQSILSNLVTAGNLVSAPPGSPVVYALAPTDTPKASELSTKISDLLE